MKGWGSNKNRRVTRKKRGKREKIAGYRRGETVVRRGVRFGGGSTLVRVKAGGDLKKKAANPPGAAKTFLPERAAAAPPFSPGEEKSEKE